MKDFAGKNLRATGRTLHVGHVIGKPQSHRLDCTPLDCYEKIENLILASVIAGDYIRGDYYQDGLEKQIEEFNSNDIFTICGRIIDFICAEILRVHGIPDGLIPKLVELKDKNGNIKTSEKENVLKMVIGDRNSKWILNDARNDNDKKAFDTISNQVKEYIGDIINDESWCYYFSATFSLYLTKKCSEWVLNEASVNNNHIGCKIKNESIYYFGAMFGLFLQIGICKYLCPQLSRESTRFMKMLIDNWKKQSPLDHGEFMQYLSKYQDILFWFMSKSSSVPYVFPKVILHPDMGNYLYWICKNAPEQLETVVILIERYLFDENESFTLKMDEEIHIQSAYDYMFAGKGTQNYGAIQSYMKERRKMMQKGKNEYGPSSEEAYKESVRIMNEDSIVNWSFFVGGYTNVFDCDFICNDEKEEKEKNDDSQRKTMNLLTIDANIKEMKNMAYNAIPKEMIETEMECIKMRLFILIKKLLPISSLDCQRLLKYCKMEKKYDIACQFVKLLLRSCKKSMLHQDGCGAFVSSWYTKYVKNQSFMQQDIGYLLKQLSTTIVKTEENSDDAWITIAAKKCLYEITNSNVLEKEKRYFTINDLFVESLKDKANQVSKKLSEIYNEVKNKDLKYFTKLSDLSIEENETLQDNSNRTEIEKEIKNECESDQKLFMKHKKTNSIGGDNDHNININTSGNKKKNKKRARQNTATCLHYIVGKEAINAKKMFDMRYLSKQLIICDILQTPFLDCAMSLLNDFVDSDGVLFSGGPVKKLERCLDKAETKYGLKEYPRASNIQDILRCAFVCNNIRIMYDFICHVNKTIKKENGGVIRAITRFKNGLSSQDTINARGGIYWDIKLNLYIHDSRSNLSSHAEVQVILKDVYNVKNNSAHSIYGLIRRLPIQRQISQNLYKLKYWQSYQNNMLTICNKDQQKQLLIDSLWNNPCLAFKMTNNDGGSLLYHLGQTNALKHSLIFVDSLKHFGAYFANHGKQKFVNYYLTRDGNPFISYGRIVGVSGINLHLKERKLNLKLIETYCTMVDDKYDNIGEKFGYSFYCNSKYLKLLDIIVSKCGKNESIARKIETRSNINCFVSRLICCRNQMAVQVLKKSLETFKNLKVTNNHIKNFTEYHKNDAGYDEVVKEMKALVTINDE